MKTNVVISIKVANVDLPMLKVECDSPKRAHEIVCGMISGSISIPEVGDAYHDQVVKDRSPGPALTLEEV